MCCFLLLLFDIVVLFFFNRGACMVLGRFFLCVLLLSFVSKCVSLWVIVCLNHNHFGVIYTFATGNFNSFEFIESSSLLFLPSPFRFGFVVLFIKNALDWYRMITKYTYNLQTVFYTDILLTTPCPSSSCVNRKFHCRTVTVK